MTGNGVDFESMEAARSVLEAVGDFEFREALIGQAAIEDCGDPLPLVSRRVARASHAVLLGALTKPGWEPSDDVTDPSPGTALTTLEKTLDVRAYVQPVLAFDGLADLSPLGSERIDGVDFVLVHALDGVHSRRGGGSAESKHDSFHYTREQIEDVGRLAFDLAQARADQKLQQPQVASLDKSNVMEISRAWREVMDALEGEYGDVFLDHMLADSAATAIIDRPKQFDVIVADHLFGGIARGEAAGLTALGIIPSARLNKERRGIFTPAQPEGMDNGYGMVMSAVAALRYSLGMPEAAERVEAAVGYSLEDGVRTPDLGGDASTPEVANAILHNLNA